MAKFTGVRPKAGGIEIRWRYQGQDYTKFINSAPTQTNLESASRQRKKFIELCKLGELTEEPKLSSTFLEVAEEMLRYKATKIKQSSVDALTSKLNSHWSLLFPMYIDEIKLSDIRHVEKKIEGIKPKTLKNSISAMKAVFIYAMDEDLIDIDPSVKIKPPKVQKPKIDSFSKDEKEAVLKAMDEKFRLFYLFMFDSGMRTGEVQGLKFTDIQGDYVHVERNIYRGAPTSTKTHQTRKVLMSPRLREAVEAWKPNRFKSEWLFSPRGSKLPYATDRTPTMRFKEACEKAEVRYRRPYFARHTYATLALRAGVKPIVVANQIGDLLETMQRNYADVMAELDNRSELEKAFES